MLKFKLVFALLFLKSLVNVSGHGNGRLNDVDIEQIYEGVTTVKLDGSHGQMVVFGQNAFPFLAGSTNNYNIPLAAGGHLGQGRIMGVARIDSQSIFQIDFEDDGEVSGQNFNRKFYANLYSWLSANISESPIALIGSDYTQQYQDFLSSLSYTPTVITQQDFENVNPSLTPYSIVIINYNFPFDSVPILLSYIQNGGSLLIVPDHWEIIGSTSESKDPTFYLNQFPPNHLMAQAGFLMSGEYDQSLQASVEGSANNYIVSLDLMNSLHFLTFWPSYENGLVSGDFSNFPTKQDMKSLSNLFTFIPRDVAQTFFESLGVYEKFQTFVSTPEFHPSFSDSQPVTSDEDRVKLLLFHYISTAVLKDEDVKVHPGVNFFPNFEFGWPLDSSFNPSQNSQNLENEAKCVHPKVRSQKSREFSMKSKNSKIGKEDSTFPGSSVHTNNYVRRWFNTGYYAEAGKVVKIQLNSDTTLKDHSIQIGVHTDRYNFDGNSQFHRIPILVVRKYIENNFVELVSPYGGSIILQVPYESYMDEAYQPNVTVTGEGAHRAPVFEYGKTSLTEWKNTIRHYPGLYTEFKTDTVAYFFPTSEAKLIENPDECLSLWTVIMHAFHDFTKTPRTNGLWRRDIIVMDYSSFAGAAHAGYPTVVPKEWKSNFVNTTEMRHPDEAWGMLHEVGHDFQEWDWWTIEGASETTNNVIVLYIQETLFGHDSALKMEQQNLREKLQTFIDNGRLYQDWQGDAFFSLGTYWQLKVIYGWGAYHSVFADYTQLTQQDRPITSQDQTDLWIVMYSLVVKENLANFFQSWGIPLSADGLAKIEHLPISLAKSDDLLLI